MGQTRALATTRFDTIVPISELQIRSRELVDQVRRTGVPIVITQRGRAAAMLVNHDLYEGHAATIDETSFPDWREKLDRAKREIASGRVVAHERVVARFKRKRR